MILTDHEWTFVRWYDYLWLLIPFMGIGLFVVMVTERERARRKTP